MKTDYPTIVSGAYGKGRVVYFANAIESLCFLNGHDDYTELYKNALDYACSGGYMLETDAPRSVHINVIAEQKDENSLVIGLVNTTGTSQRPVKELVQVPVEIRLLGRSFKDAWVLWGDAITVSQQGNDIVISIPRLREFASITCLLNQFQNVYTVGG
jgi:hypothetical protein